MKIIFIAYMLLLVAVFSSCHNKIHDGNITNKYIIPAHPYRYSTMIMVGKIPIITWYTDWTEPMYMLRVSKIEGVDTIITNDFSVSISTYEYKRVGDYFKDATN